MMKLTINISGNEVMSIDDSDVFHCYNDLWKTAPERANGHYRGIDASDNRNATKIRVGAGNRDSSVVADMAIANAFGDRFLHHTRLRAAREPHAILSERTGRPARV